MTEQDEMVRNLMGELFARVANLEKLVIHNTEALITFLPSNASDELMADFTAFSQALKQMTIYQEQVKMEKEEAEALREAHAERH